MGVECIFRVRNDVTSSNYFTDLLYNISGEFHKGLVLSEL